MQMIHYDWTITPAFILNLVVLVLVAPAYKFFRKVSESIDQIMGWLKEYRPHEHIELEHGKGRALTTDGIIIPRDLKD